MNSSTLEIRNRYERRLLLFQGLAILLLLLLLGRLADLQWLQHEGLSLQAEQNRVNVVPILPTRGEIVDRNNHGLAVNHVSYRLTLIPERVNNLDATLLELGQDLHWDDVRLRRIAERIHRARADRPVLLDDKLAWGDVAPIAAHLHELPGVDVQAGTHRFYPYGALTSHLIGYLSLAGPDDLRTGKLPSEKVGKAGVERMFEHLLHGKTGAKYEEVDAHGRRISVFRRESPVMGNRLRLSLDADLQLAAAKALGHRTGAVVVLDVRTGEVLALLSQPGIDPNRFITGLESDQWDAWLSDVRRPLLDRALQSAYPPASTFKLLVGLAGLHHRSPLALGSTQCPGYLELADRKLRCWKRKGHGHVDLHKAIVQSCDVYFYKLGDQLGMDVLRDEARLWGFGERTGIRLTPETRGIAPGTPKPGRRSRRWFRGETMITAIGQGAVNVTPLQEARFVAAIANGGRLLTPHLIADAPPEVAHVVDVRPEALAFIRKAMRDVIADPHGTAHYYLSGLPWKVAGKTGTAQVVALARDEDKDRTKPKQKFKQKDHAWFVGFAPYEQPHIAFAILVEHGGHGGSAAAPVAAALVRDLAAREQG